MDISLTPSLEAYVQRKVATGTYNDPSEVVRAALALMIERDDDRGQAPRRKDVIAALLALESELRSRGIASLALFGSCVREEARPDSDLDLLLEVEPSAGLDLIDLVAIRNLIADRLGREVEVVDRDSVHPLLRNHILAEAQQVF